MTDIYVRSPSSGRGKLIWIILGSLAVLSLAVWIFTGPSDKPEQTPVNEVRNIEDLSTDTDPMPVQGTTPPPSSYQDSGLQTLTQAKNYQATGNLQKARETAYLVLESSQDARTRQSTRKLLGELHTELVFSSRQMPEKEDYIIQRGDSLGKIANTFNTTVELLQKGNNIQGSLIRGGDRLRVLKAEFSLAVDKSDNILDVFMNGKFFKRYRVGTGKFAKTPEGEFEINDRIAQPTWWRPDGKAIPFGDPDNLLGTHWLSLNVRGYGIHGTWEPDTIGHQASAGCVRLLNEDIEELFALLPLGTPVKITD